MLGREGSWCGGLLGDWGMRAVGMGGSVEKTSIVLLSTVGGREEKRGLLSTVG
jgi:hypothetical protein